MAKKPEVELRFGDNEPDLVDSVVLVQEALGYFIGTLKKMTPLKIVLGEDCVWVRDMGSMSTAYKAGNVSECHALPWRTIYTHAIRHIGPWPHKAPKPK